MKKISIKIVDYTGSFAENKDKAKLLRIRKITPALTEGKIVILDFSDITGTTQSFIHALISHPIRQFRELALENLEYKNCSNIVKEIIKTVYEYMQESIDYVPENNNS